MGTSLLFLLIFLHIHPHPIIPWNMTMVFTCSNNVLLNYRQNICNVALYYVATLTLELRVQHLMECVTAFKSVAHLNSLSFFCEMKGLYSRRSEDNVVNGYGRSLLEMCAGLGFMILNGMGSSDPKSSFTFPHMVIVLSITLLSLRIFYAIILICLYNHVSNLGICP